MKIKNNLFISSHQLENRFMSRIDFSKIATEYEKLAIVQKSASEILLKLLKNQR
jgi:hypothetical protein